MFLTAPSMTTAHRRPFSHSHSLQSITATLTLLCVAYFNVQIAAGQLCPGGTLDCFNVCNGTAVKDCDNVCGGHRVLDCWGICDGNGKYDCLGACGGQATYDCLGLCNFNYAHTAYDCLGVCNGTADYDCTGVCAGTAVYDCAGTCQGTASYDCAGICNGATIYDCLGSCGGNAKYDCAGVCAGNGYYDNCGVCNGDNSTCIVVPTPTIKPLPPPPKEDPTLLIALGAGVPSFMIVGAIVGYFGWKYRRQQKEKEEDAEYERLDQERMKIGEEKEQVPKDFRELDKLLVEENLTVLYALATVTPTKEKDKMCRNYIKIFETHGMCLRLLKLTIIREIEHAENPNVLWKDDSIAIKLMRHYAKLIGSDYARDILSEVLVGVCSSTSEESYEVDEAKLKPEMDLDANRKRLTKLVTRTLNVILNSLESCPIQFRTICNHLMVTEATRFPTNHMAVLSVANFIFSRFFCTAVLAPEGFKIVSKPPRSFQRRGLYFLSQVLQNMSRGTKFTDPKEQHLAFMNEFIDSNADALRSFFVSISTIPSTSFRTDFVRGEVSLIERQEAFNSIHRHLIFDMKKLEEIPEMQSNTVKDWERDHLLGKMRMIADFSGERASELSLSEGNIVNVIHVSSTGWTCGEYGNRVGWFPSEFGEKVMPPEIYTPPNAEPAPETEVGTEPESVEAGKRYQRRPMERLKAVIENLKDPIRPHKDATKADILTTYLRRQAGVRKAEGGSRKIGFADDDEDDRGTTLRFAAGTKGDTAAGAAAGEGTVDKGLNAWLRMGAATVEEFEAAADGRRYVVPSYDVLGTPHPDLRDTIITGMDDPELEESGDGPEGGASATVDGVKVEIIPDAPVGSDGEGEKKKAKKSKKKKAAVSTTFDDYEPGADIEMTEVGGKEKDKKGKGKGKDKDKGKKRTASPPPPKRDPADDDDEEVEF